MLTIHHISAYETFGGEVDIDCEREGESLDDAIRNFILGAWDGGISYARFLNHSISYRLYIEVDGKMIEFNSDKTFLSSINADIILTHPTYLYLKGVEDDEKRKKEEEEKERLRLLRLKQYEELKKEFS